MKKSILFLAMMIVVLIISCTSGCNETTAIPASEGLQLESSADMSFYNIVGIGTCIDEDIVLPNNYNGKPIKAIKENAFKNNTGIKSIRLNDNLSEIESSAFVGCTNLCKIYFNANITQISYNAFNNCASLKDVYIKDISLMSRRFNSRYLADLIKNDYKLYLNNSLVTELDDGSGVYKNCISITSAVIRTKGIPENAFYNCTSLTTVSMIQDWITDIGKNAFYNCVNLNCINIPDSVDYIGEDAFTGCPALVAYGGAYYLGNSNNQYRWLIKAIDKSIHYCTINSDCRYMATGAFKNCSYLESITIPESITHIPYQAFRCCNTLKIAIIESSTIGQEAFFNCPLLKQLYLSDGVTEIGRSAFEKCYVLEEVVIPDSTKIIETWAFVECKLLSYIEIGKNVDTIGRQAFAFCDSWATFVFSGTIQEWTAINKGNNWNQDIFTTTINCTNGDATIYQ